MLKTHSRLFSLLVLLLWPALLSAADLKSETLRAWDSYVQGAQMRLQQRVRGQVSFLQVDEVPKLTEGVRAGEVMVEPEGGQSPNRVPGGLIHDWMGAVFIPSAKLDDVMAVLNEYERYKDFYRPLVVKSNLLEEGQNRELVRLLMVQKAYSVTAAVEADDEIRAVKLDGSRAYSISTSIRVQEIGDYGKPGAHALPQDQAPGYVWRTFSVIRLEQRDGGTYAEMEMIALSRGIPWSVRWLVQPLTEHLPQKILAAMLVDTRDAVSAEIRATCPATGESGTIVGASMTGMHR